jgi:hypothetical protein
MATRDGRMTGFSAPADVRAATRLLAFDDVNLLSE